MSPARGVPGPPGGRARSADAVGRIAAESLAAYPPGIPNVLPGERLTAETLDYIQTALDHGGSLRGASDRKLRTIRVVAMSWGIEDETAPLRDVLLGPPEHFGGCPPAPSPRPRWPAGGTLTPADVRSPRTREMVAAYEDAGVTVHRLEPDPALPYQVFARDSSIWTSAGPIVTQLHQWWRRGEYAPVIGFYEGAGIAIAHMVTAGCVRGWRRGAARASLRADRPLRGAHRRGRPRARSPRWLEELGWEVRLQPFDPHFVHIDVIVCMVAPGLGGHLRGGRAARAWRTGCGRHGPRAARGRLPRRDAAGRERDGAGRRPGALHRRGRLAQRAPARAGPARSTTPTCGRSRWAAAGRTASRSRCAATLRAEAWTRTASIADLRELDRRTGGPGRRAAGVLDRRSGTAAREFLRELLEPLPVVVEVDAAGNLWATAERARPMTRWRSARTWTRCPAAGGSTARWA